VITRTTSFAFGVLLIALASNSAAQSSRDLVGTWKLVTGTAQTGNGEKGTDLYGPNPTGFVTYTSDGRMSLIIASDGRKPLSVADRVAAPRDERAEAFSTCLAYAGRYTLTGDKLTHHIEVSSFQNWVNTDQIRLVTLTGNRATFRTPPILFNGKQQVVELVWERLK
jgi:Lipocalin-like domain